MVLLASSHPYRGAGNGEPAEADDGTALAAGLREMVTRLEPLTDAIALIGDTPKFTVDPPECLAAHLDDVLACAEPRSGKVDDAWRTTEASIARSLGATFIDPTDWACPTDPCPAVIGRYLVYRDQHHLATPYAIALRARLAAALPGTLRP